MLYSERKRLEKIALQEQAGTSLWTTDIPPAFKVKLLRMISKYGDTIDALIVLKNESGESMLMNVACHIIRQEVGLETLSGEGNMFLDMHSYIRRSDGEKLPDILESLTIAIEVALHENAERKRIVEDFQTDLNKLLESYRIAFSIENKEIIPIESRELHMEVVVPALRLLNKEGWGPVEIAYRNAIKATLERPEDAITDATTALQEALRMIGCKGENFADLLKSARSSIFKGFDSKYLLGIESLINWASAARVNRGDSHKVTSVESEDAWFVVHLVGVLILRTSKLKNDAK